MAKKKKKVDAVDPYGKPIKIKEGSTMVKGSELQAFCQKVIDDKIAGLKPKPKPRTRRT